MNIHQIQVSYNAQEDRILLRVLSVERAEFRFWLTRRYVKLLWIVLMKLIERDPATALHADETVRRTMLGMQHVHAVSGGEFAKPFEEGVSTFPLGEAPILLSRISGKQEAGQQAVLSLHPEQGRGLDLGVDTALLHMIAKLMIDALAQSDWDLKPAVDPDAAATATPAHRLN